MALKTYDTIEPQGDYPATEPSKTYAGKVANQNGGYIRFWFGTEEEYKALGVAEDDVLYCIFDKNSPEVPADGMTPAILGVAVLGKTILGVTSVLPKLGTPTVTLHEN